MLACTDNWAGVGVCPLLLLLRTITPDRRFPFPLPVSPAAQSCPVWTSTNVDVQREAEALPIVA